MASVASGCGASLLHAATSSTPIARPKADPIARIACMFIASPVDAPARPADIG